MKVISLQQLYEEDYHITDITPHYHFWNTSGKWSTPTQGRTASGLMYLIGCEAFYFRDGKMFLYAHPGDIIYLPKSSVYQCVFSRVDGQKESKKNGKNFFMNGVNDSVLKNFNAINIRFNLKNNKNEDFVFSHELFKIQNFKNAYSHFNILASMATDAKSIPSKIRIRLYELLNELSLYSINELDRKKYMPIINAINSIEKIDLGQLTVETLTNISGLSPSRFRALFNEYIGISPIKYIERLKIDRAYSLLKSGDLSVSEVAYMIGINDPAYFTRFYKKITGRKPTDDLN
jgi:AraC-like DNA-binding protein